MSLKVASCSQGGVALAWREDNLKFEVKLVLFHGPNTLTFQLTMEDKQIYVVGTYIPPNCTRGVEDIHRAAEAYPAGCKLLVMGDLNINIGFPHDKWEEVIVDLLDEQGLVDLSRGYWLWTPQRSAAQEHDGRGAKNGGRHGITCNQTMFWRKQRRWACLWVWGFTSHASSTPTSCNRCSSQSGGGGGGAAEEVPAQVPETPAVPATRTKGCGYIGV
jgi:hypothetical protein